MSEIRRSRKSQSRNMQSTSKFDHGHPGPIDLELPRKQWIQPWLDQGNAEMQRKNYQKAIEFYQRIIIEDDKVIDALYNRAVCLMHLNQHDKAMPDLLKVVKHSPSYDKQLYIAIGMCYITTGDTRTGLRWISKGIQKFPKYVQAYITRGQLLNSQQRWEKAMADFYKAINLNQNDPQAYIGLADSLQGAKDIRGALNALTQAINLGGQSQFVYLKRGNVWMSIGDLDQAVSDFDQCLKLSNNPEAYFQRGVALIKKHCYVEAALSFEQSIKYDTEDQKFTEMAIYNIGAIRIKQRDFYGAVYTFSRIEKISDEQIYLSQYAEAVLSLMKRKFKEGIKNLSKLIKSKPQAIKEYLGSCYEYRAYGYTATQKYQKALQDLKSVEKFKKLDKPSQYNKLMCNGIVASKQNFFEKAQSYFIKAQGLFNANTEPLCFQALILTIEAFQEDSNKKKLKQAKQLLDVCISLREQESDYYFYRAIIKYYLNRPVDAIPDYEQAIDKADDNFSIHYFSRGLSYGILKLFKEALQDFSIAIQLNENMFEAYHYRGRCAFMMEDTGLAFMDFQKLILSDTENPIVHIYAGDLLFLTSSFDDAIKAYTNGNSLKVTRQGLLQRAKGYLYIGQLDKAIEDLKQVQEIEQNNQKLEYDIEMLTYLKKIDWNNTEQLQQLLTQFAKLLTRDGEICCPRNSHFYRGLIHFNLGNYNKAQTEFRAANNLKPDLEPYMPQECDDSSLLLYNLSISCFMAGDYQETVEHLQDSLYQSPDSCKGALLLLFAIAQLAQGDIDGSQELLMEAAQYDELLVKQFEDNKGDLIISPFVSTYENFSQYKSVECIINEDTKVNLKPGLTLPKAVPPKLDMKIDKTLQKNFSFDNIKCKPEAPWLNRVRGTIQFTEQLYEQDSQSVSGTEISEDEKPQKLEEEPELIEKMFKSEIVILKKASFDEEN